MSDDAIQRALRAHFADHNFRVALLTLLTLCAAIGLWFFLRIAIGWLALLAVTTVNGTDARMPGFVEPLFWYGAAALLAAAWIDRRCHPDDRARDTKSTSEIIWEIVLAIPRATFAIGGTLSNWLHLTPPELAATAELVERIAAERRIAMHALPLEIPGEKLRSKILFALQIAQVVEIRRDDREMWLVLNPARPANLLPDRRPGTSIG